MFVLINTKDATHIAISIPSEGSEKSLPAIAAMLENNAVFINDGWNCASVVEPSMSIILGDVYKYVNNEQSIMIKKSSDIIDDDFVIYSPEVLVSNKKAMKEKNEVISQKTTEITFLKNKISELERVLLTVSGED